MSGAHQYFFAENILTPSGIHAAMCGVCPANGEYGRGCASVDGGATGNLNLGTLQFVDGNHVHRVALPWKRALRQKRGFYKCTGVSMLEFVTSQSLHPYRSRAI